MKLGGEKVDRNELDGKAENIAKTLFSYCAARTPNRFEAEDLAQDILIEVYKSAEKIRCADAFYGFLWAVANNVYKQWLRKRAKAQYCELTDNFSYESELLPEYDSEVHLLRRELSLLSEKYRKAVILYYIENKSCPEISASLKISESMVKYLLFKSRQILKEGMSTLCLWRWWELWSIANLIGFLWDIRGLWVMTMLW